MTTNIIGTSANNSPERLDFFDESGVASGSNPSGNEELVMIGGFTSSNGGA